MSTTAEAIDLDPRKNPTISVDDYAVVVGISRSAAFDAVHRGEVPAIRLGKRIRIPTAAVRRQLMLDAVPAAASSIRCLGEPRAHLQPPTAPEPPPKYALGRDACAPCEGSGRWEFEFIEGDSVFVDVEPCQVCNGTGTAP